MNYSMKNIKWTHLLVECSLVAISEKASQDVIINVDSYIKEKPIYSEGLLIKYKIG